MAKIIDINVPDIGDFTDVPIIEIHVEPGQDIALEDPLITLESDKATMDVPAPIGGIVQEVKVALGDTVSEGTLILMLQADPDGAAQQDRAQAGSGGEDGKSVSDTAQIVDMQSQAVNATGADYQADLIVLGSGPGGYTAAFRAADLGLRTILVERHKTLGGVCLNVGCIPSKALLHAAKVISESQEMADRGITFGSPKIDVDKLRGWKEGVVSRLTGGLAALAKQRKVQVVRGTGQFTGPHQLTVSGGEGEKTIAFEQAIIAAGSRVVELPFIPHDDERVIDSTGRPDIGGCSGPFAGHWRRHHRPGDGHSLRRIWGRR